VVVACRTVCIRGRVEAYLSIVGVTPSAQCQGIGKHLIEPTLAEADDAGVDCYLETVDRRNPGFYQRLGFSAVASHAEPVIGATYIIMLRNPKKRAGTLMSLSLILINRSATRADSADNRVAPLVCIPPSKMTTRS
jgi:N-acetylglutamate synthase-like GNAT family acetyltransferase